MANTTASAVVTSSPLEGEDHMIKDHYTCATAVNVGDLVVQTGASVVTLAISTTAAHTVQKCGVVVYTERILASGAQSTIDSEYAIGDVFTVCWGFKIGKGLLVVKITDPSATVYVSHGWVLGATAGDAEMANTTDLGAGFVEQNFVNKEVLITGDLFMLAEMW